jgi:hypothetical protein
MQTTDFDSRSAEPAKTPASDTGDAFPADGGEDIQSSYSTARQERLLEFQSEIVKAPEPLSAILGANTAGLFEIGRRLEEAILRRIPSQSSDLSDVQAVIPAVNGLLRVSKQAERYALIQSRFEKRAPSSANDDSVDQ